MKTLRHKSSLSEINVTPLVDVMLVLLIIFMVSAPMMKQGISVQLPDAPGKDLSTKEVTIELTITQKELFIDGIKLKKGELLAKAKQLKNQSPKIEIKADGAVPYARIAQVIGLLQSNGIYQVGLITSGRKDVDL